MISRRTKGLVITAIFALVSLAPLASSSAQAATHRDSIVTPNIRAGTAFARSIDATHGLRPNMHPDGYVVTAKVLPSNVRPYSASGCNGNVCIQVTGGGLNVSNWTTTDYNGDYICTFAAYWIPANNVWATSNEVCGTSFWSGLSSPPLPLIFRVNTQICNSWWNQPGKPCEYVHS
jgi:hypothetical protein